MGQADEKTVTEVPERMRRFPLWMDKYPIHFTVAIEDGVPNFFEQSRRKQVEACQKNLCHLCGQRLEPWVYFVLNRDEIAAGRTMTNGPCHEECVRYAIKICPYLNNPTYVGKKPVRANPATREWGIDGKGLGPRADVGPLALVTVAQHRSDTKPQYPVFFFDKIVCVDWDAVPNDPAALAQLGSTAFVSPRAEGWLDCGRAFGPAACGKCMACENARNVRASRVLIRGR